MRVVVGFYYCLASPREDAGHVVQHVGSAFLVVAKVSNQSALDHVDLALRVGVDHVAHQARELDRVLLVFEQLQLQRTVQTLVRLVIECLAVNAQRADVVHDLAAEIVLAAVGYLDFLLDRPHQSLIRLFVHAGELIPHLFALGIRLDVVDVIGAQPLERVFVGRNRALYFVLHDVRILLFDHSQKFTVVAFGLFDRDQAMMLQAPVELVEHHKRIDAFRLRMRHQGIGDLVLHVAR